MGEFSNGLFGCFNNCTLCLITYIAPCYTAGKNAEAVGDSCIMVGALYAIFPIVGIYFVAKTREKIREQKGIDVSSNLATQVHASCLCIYLIGRQLDWQFLWLFVICLKKKKEEEEILGVGSGRLTMPMPTAVIFYFFLLSLNDIALYKLM